ncbi:hypothetical protein [Rhizobium sp. 1399]|uniref:hypothetical protein n=1 Tax=Rhizobium sp. 1399 TaxID=2817758 RepID=UPI002858EA07|nr:hypothetical protein [Rhizobium sp. 1399]MDR6663996.1 hypothetical protein [Rhizobium sp. 1399]
MTDLSPREVILAYLGHEFVPAETLRAAVAQLVYAYDSIVDLASDAADDPHSKTIINALASELLMQQTLLEDYLVLDAAATALPDLVRSRRASARSTT